MLPKTILLAFILAVYADPLCDKDLLRPVEWVGGAFELPFPQAKMIFEAFGRYVPKNAIATRAQIYKDDAILAFPRYKPGVPATLAKVSLKQKGCEAVISPFPCWSTQEEGNCKAFQSVVDIFIDPNEILWVLDVGVVNAMTVPIRRCPPKVVGISLKSGAIVRTVNLAGLVAPASRLQYLAVEYANGQPFVYVTDAAARSIIVFDVASDKGYRVVLPKELLADIPRRDVLYAALVTKGCGNNFLIFTYLSSNMVYAIRSDHLRSGATGGIVVVGPKPNKIVLLGCDLGSAIFFRFEGQSEVFRWDSNSPFAMPSFVKVYDSPSGLLSTHVFPDLKRMRMRSLDSNFPDFLQNTVGCGAHQQISLLADFENC